MHVPQMNEVMTFTEDDRRELLRYLKHVVVPQNIDELKSRLLDTVQCRREIITNDLCLYLETCGFYFTIPQIVS